MCSLGGMKSNKFCWIWIAEGGVSQSRVYMVELFESGSKDNPQLCRPDNAELSHPHSLRG